MRSVLLLGATGLIGRQVLPLLLEDPSVERVIALVRRPTGVVHPKLTEQPFEINRSHNVDQIVCALGTTIKAAGSEEAFRLVDHDYPILAARLHRDWARQYILVSSMGADPKSRFFYNRVKGETERDLIELGYPSTVIARPSLLLGSRDEFRFGERIAQQFGWLMPRSMKPIDAGLVARAIAALAREQRPGVRIVEANELRALAGQQ
ncbi:MAG TPA: hypothetical protein VEU30_13790 [Thermoanaerobaculia bacterium]|nr:hypothetical protein [Thermoanaerobaculia bacterium]